MSKILLKRMNWGYLSCIFSFNLCLYFKIFFSDESFIKFWRNLINHCKIRNSCCALIILLYFRLTFILKILKAQPIYKCTCYCCPYHKSSPLFPTFLLKRIMLTLHLNKKSCEIIRTIFKLTLRNIKFKELINIEGALFSLKAKINYFPLHYFSVNKRITLLSFYILQACVNYFRIMRNDSKINNFCHDSGRAIY